MTKSPKTETGTREQIAKLLGWEEAHAAFESAVANLPPADRGRQPAGLPYSPWQLVEHLRITQHDILEFCRNPAYVELKWPDDYWPSSSSPSTSEAWDESIRQFRLDRVALQELARDPTVELEARIPHGTGQTYLRELLLVADHSAYHLGQLVVVRRLLGSWSRG